MCFIEVWKLREVVNVCVTTGHRPAQAQEEPTGWIDSNFLNSRVLASGFVIGCTKKSWFLAYIKE